MSRVRVRFYLLCGSHFVYPPVVLLLVYPPAVISNDSVAIKTMMSTRMRGRFLPSSVFKRVATC